MTLSAPEAWLLCPCFLQNTWVPMLGKHFIQWTSIDKTVIHIAHTMECKECASE